MKVSIVSIMAALINISVWVLAWFASGVQWGTHEAGMFVVCGAAITATLTALSAFVAYDLDH